MSKPATRSWITSIIASSPSTPARALYKYEILKSRLRSVAAPCANRGRQSAPGPTRKRASQHHGVTDLLPTAHHLAPKPERAPKPVSFNEVGPWPVPTRNDGDSSTGSCPDDGARPGPIYSAAARFGRTQLGRTKWHV